jgi:hypothetical protein
VVDRGHCSRNGRIPVGHRSWGGAGVAELSLLPAVQRRGWGHGGELPSLVMWPGSAGRPSSRPRKARDEYTEGGTQSADKSLINRRLLPHLQPCAATSKTAARHGDKHAHNHAFTA